MNTSVHAKGGSCPKLCARTQRACGASQTSERTHPGFSEHVTLKKHHLVLPFLCFYTFLQLCARRQRACGASQTSGKTRPGFSEHASPKTSPILFSFGERSLIPDQCMPLFPYLSLCTPTHSRHLDCYSRTMVRGTIERT